MYRLHVLFLLAVLSFISIGCDSQPNGALQNTTPNSNAPATPNTLPTSTAAIPESTPPQYSDIELEIRGEETKRLTKIWIENTQFIAEQTNDTLADNAMAVLKNICYGAPGEEEFIDDFGHKSRRTRIFYIDPHKEKPVKGDKPTCVRFVLLKVADRQKFPSWNLAVSPAEPLVYSEIDSVMVFNYELARNITNTYLRGLLVMHNMVHRDQSLNGHPSHPYEREGAAYSRELELMDQLKLPGYQTFLAEQANKKLGKNLDHHTIAPKLQEMFGDNLTDQDRTFLTYRLFLRILVEKQLLSKATTI